MMFLFLFLIAAVSATEVDESTKSFELVQLDQAESAMRTFKFKKTKFRFFTSQLENVVATCEKKPGSGGWELKIKGVSNKTFLSKSLTKGTNKMKKVWDKKTTQIVQFQRDGDHR